MPDDKAKPIIIRKKVVGHGHHGGAWKVAYADFVTAMMALFIVLWLMNSNAKVQEAVAGYFRDPAGNGKLAGTAKADGIEYPSYRILRPYSIAMARGKVGVRQRGRAFGWSLTADGIAVPRARHVGG